MSAGTKFCTCADEEHVVRPLVQGNHAVHRQLGEVDTLGEQQGARESLLIHQWMLFGKVERSVRQLQRAAEAVLSVCISDALGGGGGERERENRCEPQFFFSADTGVYQDSVTVSYRSGPGEGDGAAVAPPLLRRLPVLLVHAFEHLLDVADLVLAHG